jgi:putative peptidoglycan lipid II flippase
MVSENRRIARAAGVVGGLTLLSRIAGLARDVVIGSIFGSTAAADAFFVAFRIPNLLRRFVAEGAMNVAFVPVLTEILASRGATEAVRAARALLTATVISLGLLTALGIAFAPLWVSLLAPGFAAEPGQIELATRLTRWLLPYVFLIGLVALLGGLLNAFRHFLAPALSPVLLNLSIIAAALLLTSRLEVPVLALAYGVLIGGLLQIGAQILALGRMGLRLGPSSRLRDPVLRRVALLLAPTVLGAAVYQVNIIVNTIFASALPRGSVSFLWYADRVFEFPLGLFAVALGTAALPSFSAQAASGARDEMRRSVTFALGIASFVAVPATAGLILLADPIVHVLFERGSFGAREVAMTAGALRMYAIGLWSVSATRVVVPAFYALGDARTPVRTGAAAFLANALLALMLMGPVERAVTDEAPGASGGLLITALAVAVDHLGVVDLRHAGLALAASLASVVNLALLLLPLRRRLGGLPLAGIFVALGRSILAASVMAACIVWSDRLVGWNTPRGAIAEAVLLMLTVAGGAAVYAGAAHLLGSPETRALLQTARRAVRARQAQ